MLSITIALFIPIYASWEGARYGVDPRGGAVLVCALMGLLAEIIMRTDYESRGKTVYIVKGTTNLDQHD